MKSILSRKGCNSRAGKVPSLSTTEFHGSSTKLHCGPNELVILFQWDDLEKAQQFAQSEDLRETMQRAGVADQPDIYFLEEVEHVPA